MTSKPRTFRRTFVRITSALPLFVALVAAVWFGASNSAEPKWDVSTDADVTSIRPHVEDSPAAPVEKHDCWTGEAPADMQGVVPGHVVVTVDGVPRLGGERMVAKALEQMFDGVDHGLVVHGFCS